MSIRKKLKKYGMIRLSYHYYVLMLKNYFRIGIIKFIKSNTWYFRDYIRYKRLNRNKEFRLSIYDILPYTEDKVSHTPLDPIYFYQDCWFAGKIFETKPQSHYDVGSSAKTIGLISQFVPTTMIDIRPLQVRLTNLNFIKGSILSLPFPDNTIQSLSSICVVEHIGLGRYGDPLDDFGTEKAIKELKRVITVEGYLYLSVPINNNNIIHFNAARVFNPQYFISLFDNFNLIEEKYIYGYTLYDKFYPEKGEGTGLYMFKKIK